jgi:hypothetical protein
MMLGFELSHTAHQTGELAREITGVAGAELKLAVLKAPDGGHKIELLEYLAPPDRTKHADLRPMRCRIGASCADGNDLDASLQQQCCDVSWKAGWQTANAANGSERRKTRRLRPRSRRNDDRVHAAADQRQLMVEQLSAESRCRRRQTLQIERWTLSVERWSVCC